MRIIVFLLLSLLIVLPSFADENIKMAAIKSESLLINRNHPKLYKPTKLEIGNKAVFKIIAEPKSKAILGLSLENKGAADFNGITPRLGPNYNVIESEIPDNGILNMEYTLENNKDLVDKIMFVEAFVRQNNNNIQRAQIIGSNGQEIEFNGIEIKNPINAHGTSIIPDIPGLDADSVDALKNMTKKTQKENDALQYEKYYNADYTDYTPVYIRNLKSPEVKEQTDEFQN
ncbi:MAG: hypothetical protein WC197_03165 [Candidatus Gastranaerophilaceae bacterium]|jgi:hypothetical protein